MKFELIEARSIAGALGAEISGVNISHPMSCAIEVPVGPGVG
ncbi:MAG: hypothetical protein QNL90_09275 [Gammaproteobacteria bacterium]|nr:hypothetical protein [Gammaproteobacteria bacterium]